MKIGNERIDDAELVWRINKDVRAAACGGERLVRLRGTFEDTNSGRATAMTRLRSALAALMAAVVSGGSV